MTTARAGRKTRRSTTRLLLPLALALIVLLPWEFMISNAENVQWVNRQVEGLTGWNPDLDAVAPTLLVRPSHILREFVRVPANSKGGPEYFWRHARATLLAAVFGFFLGNLFAAVTATLFLYSKPLERTLMPLALALRSIPLVAITPLLLRIRFSIGDLEVVQSNPFLKAVFGTELFIKILVVVIICYFPSLVNIGKGLASTEPAALELLHTLRASRWQLYWKLRVPAALPLAFAGFKVTATSSILGTIVAEWLSSSLGLGYLIRRSFAEKSLPTTWAAMALSCAIALTAFGLVSATQRFVIPWYHSVVHLRTTLRECGDRA